MRLPDYHIHTYYSPDSLMKPYEAVETAISKGITDMCFTEHMDLGHHMESFNRVPKFEQIESSISELRKIYPGINIRKGLEAGYIKETASDMGKELSQQKLDYVLLSTHCVDGIDCYLPESKRNRDKNTAYKKYLETVYESIMDDNLLEHYDCIGHIGYIAKCNHYDDNVFPYSMFPQMFEGILKEIIKREKGIEVNTSGLVKAGHVLPHPSIIRRYHELGGRIITVGSDAHKPENVGYRISDTIGTIRNCGFNEITIFNNHIPEFIPID